MATPYRLRLWLGAVALAALIATVFGGTRHHAFLQFDDADYVSENAVVRRGLTWDGVVWSFRAAHAGNWHPVTWLSHMADVEMFSVDAGAHVRVNVALHFGTSLVLFLVLHRLTARPVISLGIAVLFAVHPLHVESVAWVAERKDVLCALWWMLAIAAYVRYVQAPSRGRYAVLAASFALALMSKPMAVTLPFTLLLLDIWPLRRPAGLLREKLPLFAMSLAAGVVTYMAQSSGGAVQSAETFPWALRLSNVPVAYVTYIVKTIWPANLAVLYPYPETIPLWKTLGATALLGGISLIVLRARNRRPYLAMGWLWFVVTLLPVIGVIQVGSQPYADRYMYVSSIGLFVIAAWGLSDLAASSVLRKWLITAGAIVVVAGCSWITYRQVGVWRDSISLWEHAIAVTTNNARAHTNLGFAFAEARQIDRALAEYREAIRIDPEYANAHNYLGALLSERGDHAQAAVELRAALRARPRFVEAHNNLGLALSGLGQPADAIGAFREAVRLNPAFGPAWNNLGVALAGEGQIDAAITAFEQSVRFQPGSAGTYFNLGTALNEAGRTAEARAAFEAALRIDPSFSAAREAIKSQGSRP